MLQKSLQILRKKREIFFIYFKLNFSFITVPHVLFSKSARISVTLTLFNFLAFYKNLCSKKLVYLKNVGSLKTFVLKGVFFLNIFYLSSNFFYVINSIVELIRNYTLFATDS